VGCLVYILSQAKVREKFKKNRIWCFYAVFLVLSYVLWLEIFSIGRYLVIVEMMSAIFWVKLIIMSWKKWGGTAEVFSSLLFYTMIILPLYDTPWIGRSDNSRLIAVEQLKLPKNTLVKFFGLPLAGFVPVWAKNNDFRVLGYSQYHNTHQEHSDFAERGKFREMRDRIEAEHQGSTIVVVRDMFSDSENFVKFRQALSKAIAEMYCRPLRHNFSKAPEMAYICVPPELAGDILGRR
jgi:hypothetical protein